LREFLYSERLERFKQTLVVVSVVCEAQIELTIVKLCYEEIIERSPLKAGPRDVA